LKKDDSPPCGGKRKTKGKGRENTIKKKKIVPLLGRGTARGGVPIKLENKKKVN